MSENKVEKGYVEVKEKALDSVIKKNISNINNENFNHQTKSEIWTWKEYSDLSGHLEAPNGQNFFEYDWTTKEYKLNENSEWSHFDDGSNSYDTSFNAFKEYAQNFIVENIQDDKPVKIIWKEEKKLSYEEKFELGNELLNIFEHNSLSMDNNDKYDALELINKGADLTESLRYVSNDANMYENCHWLIQNLTEEQIKEYFSNKEFADELYERAKDSVTNDKESWQDVSDIGISGFIEIAKLCNREEEANKYYKELLLENIDLKDVSKIREKTIKEYMEKLEHYDKKDKINFVLERLKAAGIEVVTDKKEFDKILEREKLLQKMAIDFSEFEKLEESINNQKSSNLHLQNEKFDLESQKKIIQQKNHTKFVEVVKQLEKYIPTNEKYIDNLGHLRSFSKVLINNTEPENDDRKNIFLIKVNNPHQKDIFVVTRDFQISSLKILGELNNFEKLSQDERLQALFSDTVIIDNFTENLKSYLQQQLVIEQQKQNKLINEVHSSMQKLKEMDIKNSDILSDFVQLDKSLRFNSNFEIESSSLNEMVSVFPGSTGKSGLGIRHIIEERYKKDNLSQDEITALSALILETVKTGELTRDSKNRCEITKNGIIAIIRKDFDDRNENWILTGFQYKGEKEEKNREATEAIQTVIAQYSHSLEYSYFRNQVGAVISSLDLNISQSSKKSSLQSIVQNGNIYGFAYEGKIYLNPDVMNSEAAVHEYTHLWDKYTQETNPELWEKGLNLFKGTSIWNEVINDKNYADIKDDENLVLSECHSRIVGKIADKVLQKVLERDGVITQKAMLDWDTEVINYIYENFKDVYEKSKNVVDIADFMAMPIKDLIREEKITHRNELSSVSNKFDQELKDYIDGKLDKNHVFLQKFLQEVEFKKDKGIKNDSQVLENPTNECSSLPNKNIHDIDSDVNKISETSISYMPHKEVMNNAKAARAMYVNPILKGEKKGLWKAFKDFKRHGVFDIQGHSISTDKDGHITDNGFKQLATAMDIYRDKRFESARYVFLDKDGNIKDQLALSTFMPNHSISKLDETFEQVVKYAQASNTRVAFVHNHPSGNIEASLDDIRFTKNLEEYLNRNGKDLFAGHIILDHNTFNCFKPGNDWQPVSFDTTEKDRFEKENVPEFTKTKIDSVDNLLSVAKSINDTNEYNKNWIPVVFSRTDASIGGIEYFSKDYFTQNKSEDIQKDLQNIGLLCGSNRAIPVIPKELSYDEKLHSEVINKFRDGCFYDFALGNRTAKDLNLENMSTELFNYTVKEMQTNTMVESTFELPKVDKKEIGVSSKVAENTNYYKKENIQPVDLSSYIDKSKSTEVFEHDFMLNKKFVPPFVFADNNCYIRCNAKDLKINSALKLNPEKKVDVIVTKAQFAKIISDEKLKEKISKLKEYKKTKKPITPLEVASAKMSTEQEELILAQDPHLNFTDRKLTYNAMYKEIMTDVSKLDKEKAENAITLIKQSDKEFEQIKKDFIQTNGNFSKATKNQNEAIDY